jgi:uncharacterized protein (DUF362 family)
VLAPSMDMPYPFRMQTIRVHIGKRQIGETPFTFTQASIAALIDAMGAAFDGLGNTHSLLRGSRTVVKPNLVRPGPAYGPAVNTDPRVVAAVCAIVHDAGASEIIVGDDPGWGLTSSEAYAAWGHENLIEDFGGTLVPFDTLPRFEVEVRANRLLRRVSLPGLFRDIDVVINVPKMKTHMLTNVSLGLKNLHGLVPDEQRLLYHRGDVEIKLVDILSACTPHLTVIDGIWALEGQAPLYGKPITNMNTLVTGNNPVAVDAVGASIMGFDPFELGALREASRRGLGPLRLDEIQMQGTPLREAFRPFRRALLSSIGVFDRVDVIEGAADPGALNALRHALDRLSLEGYLAQIDSITILVGRLDHDRLPRIATQEVWLFGDSALTARELVARNHRVFEVPGDPPHIFDLYKAFLSAHQLA